MGLSPSHAATSVAVAADGHNVGLIAVIASSENHADTKDAFLSVCILQPDAAQGALMQSDRLPLLSSDITCNNNNPVAVVDAQFHRSHVDVEWPQLVVMLQDRVICLAMAGDGRYHPRWQRLVGDLLGSPSSSAMGDPASMSTCLLCPFGIGWVLVGTNTGLVVCCSGRGEPGQQLPCLLGMNGAGYVSHTSHLISMRVSL